MHKESSTDILILGAGPAGLMAHLSLSAQGIPHRIVDKRGTRALNGRADGFHVRTVEIWAAFGLLPKLQAHANHFGEWALWTPADGAGIARQDFQPVIGEDVSRMHTASFHQGYVEAALIEAAAAHGGPGVERGVLPTSLHVDETRAADADAYPVTLELKHLQDSELESWPVNAHRVLDDGTTIPTRGSIDAFGTDAPETIPTVTHAQGSTETLHARYVLAADGGRSWTRHQLPGLKMEGASAPSVWAVIDVRPLTTFPDIRKNCTVLSSAGTALIIPREAGLVRLYIQLPAGHPLCEIPSGGDGDAAHAATIMELAAQIFAPYKLTYRECDWWTIYRVGQRVANAFSHLDRVLLAGDAVHTHTPKGGQGMNVSQADAFNAAWKLGGVVSGRLRPGVLGTYETERRPLAQALVALDADLARVLDSGSAADPADVQSVYARLKEYGSGVNAEYAPSMLIAGPGESRPAAATGLRLGRRMPDVRVFNVAAATPVGLHSLLSAGSMWRLFVFAGDVTSPDALTRVNAAAPRIESVARKFVAPAERGSFLDVYFVHAGTTADVEAGQLHSAYFPYDEQTGHDYGRVFADSVAPHAFRSKADMDGERAHSMFGVDVQRGAVVLCRPDQVIAWIGGLEDVGMMEKWLGGFMVARE